MPADTFSTLLGTLVMGTGNDNNNWGDNANSQVFAVLEKAIAGAVTRSVNGGTLDLSANAPPAGPTAALEKLQIFTGTLAANQTVKVPNLAKTWVFKNATTGNFSLLVQTPSGSATEIPQGTEKAVYCDGSNGVFRTDRNEVGLFADFAGTTAPSGYFECNGSVLLIANHPDLYARIGTTWGGNGITTFALPLLTDTGRFRRSRTGSLTVGTYQANQIGSHSHTGSVTVSGSATTSGQSQSHTHTVTLNDPGHDHATSAIGGFLLGGGIGIGGGTNFSAVPSANTGIAITNITVSSVSNASQDHTHSVSMNSSGSFTTAATGGSEERPEAAVVMTCIRY